MNTKPDFSNLPKPSDINKAQDALKSLKSEDSLPQNLVAAIYGNSPHLSRIAEHERKFLAEICQNGFEESLKKLLAETDGLSIDIPKKDFIQWLRRYKNRASLLIALADISNNWNLRQITGSLTDFADKVVQKALQYLFNDRYHQKLLSSPEQKGFFILAVGKQGSRELNYSSDIDIIALYDEENNNFIGKVSAKEFYVRLTQELVEILQQRTADGYVFRVDLRLRPDPYSTPLAVSVKSSEIYYKTVGQNWERAAMIKARCVAGDFATAEHYLHFLESYIWRKHLDFKALEDIRSVKRQIDAKTDYKPESLLGYNIKLGKGGIREIEFYAQTQQLIWGGRDEALRVTDTCSALIALEKSGKIQYGIAAELIAAYEFYRTVEHRLQMIADEHTHSLPNTQELFDKFCVFMGYENCAEFTAKLSDYLAMVQRHYAKLFDESPNLSAGGNLVFTGVADDPETLITLSKMGFTDTERVCEIVRGWHHGRRPSTRFQRVREILTEFVPHILKSFASSNNPDEALFKFDDFLEQIPNGVLLFSLLEEKPELIDLLAEIMGNSPWLANNFSRSPALINHILTIDFYTDFPKPSELKKEIQTLLHGVDAEEKISVIRRWKHDKEFQVGIRLLKNIITHDMAAEDLSNIAEIIISKIFKLVNEDKTKGQIAIIAMGKLGLRDLTFGSDLDLVFVYESQDAEAQSYYTKIVNKFIQTINALSNEGMLYSIDTRLRPMGEKGAIACSLETYERYYQEAAWNWELMALTKARVIYGDSLGQKIGKIIALIISEARDAKTLAEDMHKMRLKIAETYPDSDIWDVKYARGGLFEAEFVLQYRTLTTQNPAPDSVGADFAENYNLLRDVQSAIRLTIGAEEFDEVNASENQKNILTKSVGEKNFEAMKAKLIDAQKKIHEYYSLIFN